MNISDSFLSRNNSPSRSKKIFIWTIFFIIGLIAGLSFFFPRESLWHYLMSKADHKHEAVRFIRYDLIEAEWNKTLINNLEISFRNHEYFLPEIQITLGLRPFLQAVVNTGPEIKLKLETRKKLSALGEIDLAGLLPGQGMTGNLWINGNIFFQTWSQPPAGGTIELESRGELKLEDSLDIENLKLQTVLADNRLEIRNLSMKKPLDFTCSGHVLLNWDNLIRSNYDVQGHFRMADDSVAFEQRGVIADLIP